MTHQSSANKSWDYTLQVQSCRGIKSFILRTMYNVCLTVTMLRMVSSHHITHKPFPVHNKVQPFPIVSHTSCARNFLSVFFLSHLRSLPAVSVSALLHFQWTLLRSSSNRALLFKDISYYTVKGKILQFIPWVHSQTFHRFSNFHYHSFFFLPFTLIMHLNSRSLTLNLLQYAVINIFDPSFIIQIIKNQSNVNSVYDGLN